MAIQITNDPINQFLDNLPRYALEMRRQDSQAAQFDRQMDLREQAAANQQTLFDLTRNRQKFTSDVFKEQYKYQQDYRNASNEWNTYKKKYDSELEGYKESKKVPIIGELMTPDYLVSLERSKAAEEANLKSAEFWGKDRGAAVRTRTRIDKLSKAINDYKALPDLSTIRPRELSLPKGLELDRTLYGFATQSNLQKSIDDEINSLYDLFGGTQMGRASEGYLSIQQAEIGSSR